MKYVIAMVVLGSLAVLFSADDHDQKLLGVALVIFSTFLAAIYAVVTSFARHRDAGDSASWWGRGGHGGGGCGGGCGGCGGGCGGGG